MDSDHIVSFDAAGLRLDTSEDAEVICEAMTGKEVEILILQGNTFGIEAAERVGIELSKQPKLREAHFKDLFTSRGREEVPEAMKHLLKGISDSGAQLTLLDLSDNAIGPIGAPSVIEFLSSQSSETLRKLYLNNNGLGPEGSTSIAAVIPRLVELQEFICGRNRLEDKGATNMSRALSELNNLQILKMSQNGIQVTGIQKLVEALQANRNTLIELDLSDNTIKEIGSEAIAKVIIESPNLRSLNLSDALLENQGFSIICDALSKSPALEEMEMAAFEGNELHGHNIVDLVDITFSVCKQDFTLVLLANEFGPDELTRLESLKDRFNILVDDIESDDDSDDRDDESGDSYSTENRSDIKDGPGHDSVQVETELREIFQYFVTTTKAKPLNASETNFAFGQLVSTGQPSYNIDCKYNAIQILCEELGLIKYEPTRKKKPQATEAIAYIRERTNELPDTFKEFFEVIFKTGL